MKKVITLYQSQDLTSNITVEYQEKKCRDFAKSKGWQIKHEYTAVEGVSGTLDSPLVKIKKKIEDGEVDTILVYAYFYLSDNHMELPMVIKWLLSNNIEFWSVMEGNFLAR